MRCIKYIGIFILLAINLVSYVTLANNNSRKIKIHSERLVINKIKAEAIFHGAVKLYFDQFILYSNEIQIKYTEKQNIKTIIIPGKLKVLNNSTNEIITADSGDFDNITKILILKNNVKIMKDSNILTTDRLVYISDFKALGANNDK